MTNERTLREAPIWKLLVKMSLPMILVMTVSVLYNMADVFFLGRTGDTLQVAAVSLAAPVFAAMFLQVRVNSGAGKYFSGAQATKCIPIFAQPTIRLSPML